EAGHAHGIIVAYFDRLARNLDTQREVVDRVEAAHGEVFAVDTGAISHGTSAQRLQSGVLGLMAEHYASQTGEKLADTQDAAIAEGIPIGALPPGYRKDPLTRRVVLHEAEAEVMRTAFALRADGASWAKVRRYMATAG